MCETVWKAFSVHFKIMHCFLLVCPIKSRQIPFSLGCKVTKCEKAWQWKALCFVFFPLLLAMCSSYPVEFHVEPTGVADGFSLCVSSPQGGGGGVTICAGQAHPPRGRLQQANESLIEQRYWGKRSEKMKVKNIYSVITHQPSLGFNERPVDAIHLVVQAACVAQVVAGAIAPPEGSWHCTAVHTFSSLSKVIKQIWKDVKKIMWVGKVILWGRGEEGGIAVAYINQ